MQLNDLQDTLLQSDTQKTSLGVIKKEVDLGYNNNNNNVIYPVTEGINSSYTRQAYKTSFNRFQSVIKIHDLQVLRDLGPKVMEQMIIKYVINARDVKKLSRASIQAECDAIYHFCELNDLLLNKKKINRFLPPLLESFWLVSRTLRTVYPRVHHRMTDLTFCILQLLLCFCRNRVPLLTLQNLIRCFVSINI